jgi:hypothetical protein
MKTNLEKWDYYMDILNKRADKYINSLNLDIPSVFYEVMPNGAIHECDILKKYISLGLYYSGKKPSNEQVKKIEFSYANLFNFNPDLIYIEFKYMWGIYDGKESFSTSSVSIERFNEFIQKEKYYLSKEMAEAKSIELKKISEENKQFREENKKDTTYNYSENGYKFLGWQNGWKQVYFDEDHNLCSETGKPHKTFGYLESDYPEFGKCQNAKHRTIEVSHNNRGSENTVSCPVCKIYWKYDCSD